MKNSAMWTWTGSGYVPCDSVPLSDRGFRYGMSLFESLRLHNGTAQYFEAHLESLTKGCAARGFGMPVAALHDTAGLFSQWKGTHDGFARIYVTAGDGAPTDPASECRVFVFIEERERPAQEAYALTISDETFHPTFGGLKTGNYWTNLDVLARARLARKDEALLFNERAELVSSCVGNVFLVRGGEILTPALCCGAREGVIRQQVLARYPVRECSLFVDDVRGADEIFLTNSWIGAMPAASLQGRELPSRAVCTAVRKDLGG